MELAVKTRGISPFLTLIEQNNINGVETLIAINSKTDFEQKNDVGQTCLHFALELGHTEIVWLILNQKVEVNSRDKDDWTPLISAAKLGDTAIVSELISKGAKQRDKDDNELVDMGNWSAVTWAAYKGHSEILSLLLVNGGEPSSTASFGMAPILWAAGRGHDKCVKVLMDHGADVHKSDKFGSTALYWGCRKGHYECVKLLLRAEVDANAVGANGQSSIIVASKNAHVNCVQELLKYDVNVNQTDKDGNSALGFAAASGESAIAERLLVHGAYLNHPNHKGDTPIILAGRHSHLSIVKLLLARNANVNHCGSGNKTVLFWATDNSKVDIVRDLLRYECDTEIYTDDHETCLLRAVKNRFSPIVDALLRHGSKVSARDGHGDNPLHISLRSKNKNITEMLLRNPRDSRLLYKMNDGGETPYQIDLGNKKSILTQIFGTKSLSEPKQGSNDLSQYDLYSSALADILSEPTMVPPLTVGVYAQWGSGKSFLLKKLQDIMESFVGETGLEEFRLSVWWFLPLVIVLSWACGLVSIFVRDDKERRDVILLSLIIPTIGFYFLGIMFLYIFQNRWDFTKKLAHNANRLDSDMKIVFNMLFYEGVHIDKTARNKPVKFLFTDYSRLSSVGGETSLAEMVGALTKTAERNFGIIPTRVYRALKPRSEKDSSRKFCCFPLWLIVLLLVADIFALSILMSLHYSDQNQMNELNTKLNGSDFQVDLYVPSLWACGMIGIAFTLILFLSYWPLLVHLTISPYRRVLRAAQRVNQTTNSSYEAFMMTLKKEVEHLSGMVTAFDGLGSHQTRLVVVVNGLDSCEQDRVLDVLETVNVLFTQSPYIVILAIDDNIIVKAVDRNLNMKSKLEINGRDYLRNMIHLPFYMQDQSIELLKRQRLLPGAENSTAQRGSTAHLPMREKSVKIIDPAETSALANVMLSSNNSIFSSNDVITDVPRDTQTANQINRRRPSRRPSLFNEGSQDTIESTRMSRGGFDLTKMLATEDWFSSISPQIMKRILNVVSLTGRLLRANRLSFTWDRLAGWINMTEVWPYRTSWIVLYIEEHEDLDPKVLLKSIYQKIMHLIPQSSVQEPLLEIDNVDSRQLEVFLSAREPALTVRDVIRFLPCTVNLDPKLREWIIDWQVTRAQTSQPTQSYDRQHTTSTVLSPIHPKFGVSPNLIQMYSDGFSPTNHGSVFSPLPGQIPVFPPKQSVDIRSTFEDMSCEELSNWAQNINGLTSAGRDKIRKFFIQENLSGFVVSKMGGNFDVIRNSLNLCLGDYMYLSAALMREISNEQQNDVDELVTFSIPESRGRSPMPPNHERLDSNGEIGRYDSDRVCPSPRPSPRMSPAPRLATVKELGSRVSIL